MPFGSFFDASSKSEAIDRRVALTDQAVAATERATLAVGGVAVGEKGRLNTGLDLQGGKVMGDLVLGDSAGMLNLAGMFTGALSSAGEAQSKLLDKVLDSVSGLAETKVTDGENLKLKLVWWGVAAAAVVAGIWFWRRK